MTDSELLLTAIKCTTLSDLTTTIATYLGQPLLIVAADGQLVSHSMTPVPTIPTAWLQTTAAKQAFHHGTTEYLRRPINTFALKPWYLFVAQTKGYPVVEAQLKLVIEIINHFNERYAVNPNQSEMNSLFAELLAHPAQTDITLFGALSQAPLVAITATPLRSRPNQSGLKTALQTALPSLPLTEDAYQNLVGILPATTAKFEQATFAKLAETYHYTFFISEPYRDLTKSRDFVSICRQAFKAAQKMGPLAPVNLTQAYNIYIILDHIDNLDLLRNTMCTQLLALQHYDTAHHTELFDTLYVYLENDCRASTTAEQLHLHRNSLTKRLQRIDDLVHIDWDMPHKTFGLRLSYRIFNYLGH